MIKLIKKILKIIFFIWLKEKLPTQTKIDKWKEYAEKLLIDSGIELENVLVHNYGKFGLQGLFKYSNHTSKDFKGTTYKFKIPNPELPYIIVPEISGLWEFHAWIHEIGHYNLKHCSEFIKPLYVQEYEAEKFSLDKAKESGVVSGLELIDMKYDALCYVESYIDKAIEKNIIKSLEDINKDVLDFMCQSDCYKKDIEGKFVNTHISQKRLNSVVMPM